MLTYVDVEGNPRSAPPGRPPPGWKERFVARQKVAAIMVAFGKAAPQASLASVMLRPCQSSPEKSCISVLDAWRLLQVQCHSSGHGMRTLLGAGLFVSSRFCQQLQIT